jgi:hypothetical protein
VIRCAAAEAIGTAFLLAAVVGSGIMGERLAGGNVAIALLANTIATAAALIALILTFGPVPGATGRGLGRFFIQSTKFRQPVLRPSPDIRHS